MTFQVTPTADIQAESLRLFMAALGYYPARQNGGFITMNPALAANSQYSTRTAITLHNLSREDWKQYRGTPFYGPEGLDLQLLVTEYTLNVIMATKLVEKVKFQASRKAPCGLVFPPDQNANLIRAMSKGYLPLFGITE